MRILKTSKEAYWFDLSAAVIPLLVDEPSRFIHA